jgi:myo-inositol-1-phosphate synthase
MALRYTRVKDKETGHQYDVLSHKVNPELHEVVKRYSETSIPRAPKPSVKARASSARSGRSARTSAKDAETSTTTTTTDQSAAGA